MKVWFTKRVSAFAWIVWGLAALFFFVQYIARVVPAVATFQLMSSFSTDAFAIGGLSAIFYYAYAGMQLPIGLLFDRYGARYWLVVSTWIMALGCFIFAAASSLWLAHLGRLLMGLGGAFAFIGAIKLANIWFPANWLGLLTGLTEGIGLLGAVLGGAPTSWAINEIGWRRIMVLLGILFLLIGVALWIAVRERKKNSLQRWFGSDPTSKFWDSLKSVLIHRQTWINALYITMIYAPTTAFGEFWGPSFLSRVDSLSMKSAAGANSMIFLGWMVGAPLLGWLSDRCGRRKPFMLFSSIAGLLLLAIVLYLHLSFFWLMLVLFLYGVANTGLVVALAVSTELHSPKVAGTAIAFANMATILIGMFLQPVIGLLLDIFWNGVVVRNVPYYSAHDFKLSMSVLLLCFASSLISLIWIRETYCKRV